MSSTRFDRKRVRGAACGTRCFHHMNAPTEAGGPPTLSRDAQRRRQRPARGLSQPPQAAAAPSQESEARLETEPPDRHHGEERCQDDEKRHRRQHGLVIRNADTTTCVPRSSNCHVSLRARTRAIRVQCDFRGTSALPIKKNRRTSPSACLRSGHFPAPSGLSEPRRPEPRRPEPGGPAVPAGPGLTAQPCSRAGCRCPRCPRRSRESCGRSRTRPCGPR